MARVKLARWLYGLALLAMPLSYATRDLFGVVGITWVNPTLILGLSAFLLTRARMKEKASLWLVVFAFVSAFIGMFLMGASPDRGKDPLYVYYVEPIRLTLNIVWFWISLKFLKFDKKLVVRCVAICVVWEFVVACYLYLALYEMAPVPQAVYPYLALYKTRQALPWGDADVYRMAGTFIEPAPFGLFMLCCFVVFALVLLGSEFKDDKRSRAWARVGAICAFLGVAGSLSDQALIALLVLVSTLLVVRLGRNKVAQKLLWSSVLVALTVYVTSAFAWRSRAESEYTGDPMGMSRAERLFHVRYGLGLLAEQPASIVTGIGPGRYGDYAVRTGYFPSTVQPQVAVIEWLVGYGVVGLLLIGRWLSRIGAHAALGYGRIGTGAFVALVVAIMFQANWMWESWFLALAFMYAGARTRTLPAAQGRQG